MVGADIEMNKLHTNNLFVIHILSTQIFNSFTRDGKIGYIIDPFKIDKSPDYKTSKIMELVNEVFFHYLSMRKRLVPMFIKKF